jgi:hypothetical protein
MSAPELKKAAFLLCKSLKGFRLSQDSLSRFEKSSFPLPGCTDREQFDSPIAWTKHPFEALCKGGYLGEFS